MSWTAWEASQTASTFKAIFPEFTRADDALVESRIAMAAARTPADVWEDHTAQGIAWLTAHLVALAPGSKDLRLDQKKGGSMYLDERRFLEGVVSSGFRIAGLP